MIKKLNFVLGIAAIMGFYSACTPKLNNTATANGDAGQLKIMSYNIHHANPPSKVGFIDLGAVAKVIKNENPDLVGLQEVDRNTKRSGNIDEAKVLAAQMGMFYQFFKAIDHDGGDYGLAILSKYPIGNGVQIALPQVTKGEPRILSYVTVKLKNQTLTFANTHLDATKPDSNRVVQMQTILNELGKKSGPVILVGDLNCEAKAQPIVLLDQQFKRSCTANCAFTIPQDRPRKTIDYIALKNANWQVNTHNVIAEVYASDHRPVVVAYEMK